MTPQASNKREASTEENNEEVCKKAKKEPEAEAATEVAGDTQQNANKIITTSTTTTNTTSTTTNGNKSEKKAVADGASESATADADADAAATTTTVTDVKAPAVEVAKPAPVSEEKVAADATEATATATAPDAAATTTADPEDEEEEEEEEPAGTLLICGGANWDMTGRKELPKNAKKPVDVNPAARSLWGPHRVVLSGSDKSLRVRGVFSGCNACHSVIVTEDGLVMTFGRNDKGQLGLGDTETRFTPEVVEALRGIDIVAAACGRSHTLFLSSDGIVFSCGDNKMGQCGTNQQAVQQILTPCRIAFKENRPVAKIACGAEFSMIVDGEGRLYSFGHPEHGQLGHNSEGKYFTSGNKYAFHCEHAPRRITTYIEKSREGHVSPVDGVQIVDIACGTNHTLAVDTKNRCFSWGFAGYHRLGHSETKNELLPRSIKVFDAPNNSGRGAVRVFAGATHSMALDVNGLLYFWGQNKSSGEATMYPKNVQDLCGWKITAVACANRSIFVVADDSCISWGPSPTYGELGYGEGKSKSSTIPQEVKTLDGVHVTSLACGHGHTLLIARDKSPEEQTILNKLKSWP